MKLLNIFKKEFSRTSDSKNAKIQKLEKNQLSKVIGGGDDTTTPDETTSTEGNGGKRQVRGAFGGSGNTL